MIEIHDKTEKTYPIITVDGSSGAGKGTLCWRLAEKLGYQLLDSGALYRIIGLKAQQTGLLTESEPNEEQLEALTLSLIIRFVVNSESNQVDILVNDELIGMDIRNETVGGYASRVAIFPKVRTALLALQRNMAKDNGVIADGRDMGTVIFPNAQAKVFLTASAEARADRRYQQLLQTGQKLDYQLILTEIKERDARDENRSASPSKPADDALVIDSSSMSVDQVFTEVQAHCIAKGIRF